MTPIHQVLLIENGRKSQIAVEFVWRLRERCPEISIYWVHASSAPRFNQSYREIAEVLDLPDRDNPNVDVLRQVFDHLSNKSNGKWMMVLDNADDSSIFSAPRGSGAGNEVIRQLSEALPQVPHGSILITSRDRKTADELVVDSSTVIDVNPMPEEDASILLRLRSADKKSSDTDVAALVCELENIPLAVTQAAAFISQKSPRMTISRYLTLFQQSTENQASLLAEETTEIQRDPLIPNAILTSWAMTFDQIRERYPSSSDLIAIMSYLDPQAIPESLFTSKLAKDGLEFERRISPLVSFSLISPEVGGTSFTMHRLVQVATKAWLKKHKEDEKWRQEAMDLIVAAFPDASDSERSEQWAKCEELSPHAESILKQLPSSLNVRQNLAHAALLHNTAYHANLKGEFSIALEKWIAAREIRSQLFGWGDPEVHNTSNLISSLLSETGRGEIAIRSLRASLRRRADSLGPDHKDSKISLEIMAKLSELLREQGKIKEAQDLAKEATEGLEKLLGSLSPSTLSAKRAWALVLLAKRRVELARSSLEGVLQQRRDVLGPGHIDTLKSTLDLATLYSSQLRYREAFPLLRSAADNLKKSFGPEHRLTVEAMKDLEEAIVKSQMLRYSLLNGSLARLLRFVTRPDMGGTFAIIVYLLLTTTLFMGYVGYEIKHGAEIEPVKENLQQEA
jgi:tetratricopeptide (TPR) repeat protein